MYMYIWLCNVPLRVYSEIKCCILCHIVCVVFHSMVCVTSSIPHNCHAEQAHIIKRSNLWANVACSIQ